MDRSGADSPLICTTKAQLRAAVAARRAAGQKTALVPTMGALHAGHLSLIDQARRHADCMVCSVFVNPTQFAPEEDLEDYPRNEEADIAALQSRRVDIAWMPSADEMYPDGFQTEIRLPSLASGLCGASRPHHFAGVATVVCKLFNQVRPDVAVFGEKDFQQLRILQQLSKDLDLDIEVLGAPIVREGDGLAMSSRNAYLTTADRRAAPALYFNLCRARNAIRAGTPPTAAVNDASERLVEAGFEIDYVRLCDPLTLDELDDEAFELAGGGDSNVEGEGTPARLFGAAWLGETRLIDNVAI